MDPISNRVYVTNFVGAGSVWVVDGRTKALVATVPVGDSPFGIAANPLTRRVYAGNSGENTISVIDEATNKVIANFPSGRLSRSCGRTEKPHLQLRHRSVRL